MNYSISGIPWQSKDQDVVLSLPWAWVQALVEGTKMPLSHVAQSKKKKRVFLRNKHPSRPWIKSEALEKDQISKVNNINVFTHLGHKTLELTIFEDLSSGKAKESAFFQNLSSFRMKGKSSWNKLLLSLMVYSILMQMVMEVKLGVEQESYSKFKLIKFVKVSPSQSGLNTNTT